MKLIYTAIAVILFSTFAAFNTNAEASNGQCVTPVSKPTTAPPGHVTVPEPSTLILLGSGLFGLAAARRLKNRE